MNISVIIPTYNSSKTINLCLESIKNQTIFPYEIIVVDDDSSDDTLKLIKDYDLKILRNDLNRGPAYARNKGAKNATGDILFFIDSDIVIPKDAIEKIIEIFYKTPKLSCVCGIYSKYPLMHKGFISYYRTLQSHYWKKTGCGFTTRFTVSCGAVKRADFYAVGGFNEKFKKADIEDYEIGHKLIAKGYKIYQTNEIETIHDDIHTFGGLVSTLFIRSFLYPPLLFKRKKLDTGYLNKKRALAYPTALFSLASLFISFINPVFLWAWLLFIAITLLLDIGLYNIFRKEKGNIFMVKCILLHYLILNIMAVGFILGTLGAFIQLNHLSIIKQHVFINPKRILS